MFTSSVRLLSRGSNQTNNLNQVWASTFDLRPNSLKDIVPVDGGQNAKTQTMANLEPGTSVVLESLTLCESLRVFGLCTLPHPYFKEFFGSYGQLVK